MDIPMSKSTMTHMHHIIPKHMGGTDDPENLVELTIEEHAEAHRKLYEKYGKIEDKIAWKALLGRIDREEAIHMLVSRPATEERKRRISEALRGQPKSGSHKQAMRKPKNWTNEGLSKISKLAAGRKPSLGKIWTQEERENHSRIMKNRSPIECPHCGVVMDPSNAKRYHFDQCKSLS